MWICLNDSFLSIVSDKNSPDHLLVRARRKGDIERIFPNVEIKENIGTDYKYRSSIDRRSVSSAIADRVLNIDYDNFKNSVSDPDRHDAYLDVWTTMFRFQR